MDINRNNYEHYFLDFIEEKLSPEEEDKLRDFLQNNPDLADELKGFEILDLPDDQVVFPAKVMLKKQFPLEGEMLDDHNFDMFSIAYLEGDLSNQQKALFEKFIQNRPKQAKDFMLLKSTVLQPEPAKYPFKSQLKRRKLTAIRFISAISLSAAAAITLLFIFGPQTQESVPQIADLPSTPSTPEVVEEVVEESPTKQTVKTSTTATIKVIRNSKNPVPVTKLTKDQLDKNNNAVTNAKLQSNSRKSIASINLKKTAIKEVNTQYDQFVPLTLSPTTISRSSLSLADQARLEYSKAAKIAEDEDVLIWNLASNGIKELNRITGSDMKLLASKDQEGDISGIQFRSRFFQFTTPIERAED